MQQPDDRVIGIDLGMTSVVAAHVPAPGQPPSVLRSEHGTTTLPSVVALRDPEEQPVVGQVARDMLTTHPQFAVTGFKRLLGRKPDSPAIRALAQHFGLQTRDDNGELSVRVGHQWMHPPELLSVLLKRVRELAEFNLGSSVHQCVLAVPTYFGTEQKQAIIEASHLAGMTVRDIIPEPTAILHAYEIHQKNDTQVAIIDMGGVRLDVSVINITNGAIEMIADGGHPYLGGTNIDAHIIDWILKRVPLSYRDEVTNNPQLLLKLQIAAESAKHKLSRYSAVNLHIQTNTGIPSASIKPLRLDSHTLQSLASETTQQIHDTISKTLNRDRVRVDSIREVILVGGTTRLPFIQKFLHEYFGKEPRCSLPPEQVVAFGAALAAKKFHRSSRTIKTVSKTTVGIALANGRLMQVIERSSNLPVTRRIMIPTFREYQTSIEVDIFENAEDDIIEAIYLGTIVYQGLKEAPAGKERLTVDLSFDASYCLRVSSPEPGRGGEVFELAIAGHSSRKNSVTPEPSFYVAQELPK